MHPLELRIRLLIGDDNPLVDSYVSLGHELGLFELSEFIDQETRDGVPPSLEFCKQKLTPFNPRDATERMAKLGQTPRSKLLETFRALKRANWVRSETLRLLDISRPTLFKRIDELKALGFDVPDSEHINAVGK